MPAFSFFYFTCCIDFLSVISTLIQKNCHTLISIVQEQFLDYILIIILVIVCWYNYTNVFLYIRNHTLHSIILHDDEHLFAYVMMQWWIIHEASHFICITECPASCDADDWTAYVMWLDFAVHPGSLKGSDLNQPKSGNWAPCIDRLTPIWSSVSEIENKNHRFEPFIINK